MSVRFPEEEFHKLRKLLLVYGWGHQILLTNVNIVYEDFKHFQDGNPIESIRSRIKTPESIADKLQRWDIDLTVENAREHIKDIAGIRIICTYARDIPRLAELLRKMPNVNVTCEKDYVSSPKQSGYRGYHLYTEVPVFFSGIVENIPVEIQIRTAAMDFWATLEHRAKYKYKQHIPEHLSDELVKCADTIADIDKRMFTVQCIISKLNNDEV